MSIFSKCILSFFSLLRFTDCFCAGAAWWCRGSASCSGSPATSATSATIIHATTQHNAIAAPPEHCLASIHR
ncbi:hypothetical protein K402DRAFT_268186 [Aulographum hederae CBS 113979]|uniref:Secreted protein n=1 Tax=Aulographum hederae CBS 113979 TaxID=1176131 RepID=A0A6G1H8H3_9PEZI|nr:hypothetical protein K402DRAFT_268186 [Aulographum hederae CBS 113979]